VKLSLRDVRRIADDVAKRRTPPLDVVAVKRSQEGSSYTEVLLTTCGFDDEPCRLLVGVSSDISESECQQVIEARLRQHLAEHRRMTVSAPNPTA
jgi:hypothetical protein